MEYLLETIKYVGGDNFFWLSMAGTTIVGLYIGAIVYNGDVIQVRKMLVALISYVSLLVFADLSRIIPTVASSHVANKSQPFAGVMTTFLITIFYLFGMWLGVKVVRLARGHKMD